MKERSPRSFVGILKGNTRLYSLFCTYRSLLLTCLMARLMGKKGTKSRSKSLCHDKFRTVYYDWPSFKFVNINTIK